MVVLGGGRFLMGEVPLYLLADEVTYLLQTNSPGAVNSMTLCSYFTSW